VQRWRVPLGFICGTLFLVLARPTSLTLTAGGAVALLGLALRAWAAGHIRKNSELATSGPYAYTRNPLYLGSFLLGLGFTIAAGRPILGLLFVAIILGIYLPVMRVEAATLSRLFGEDYTRYEQAVPLFFPRLLPYRDAKTGRAKFDAGLYLRYREYQAAIGLVIAWAMLALKALFVNYSF
jgi:protein-S-isoprenylcysteine O-methyltransferase Ste14